MDSQSNTIDRTKVGCYISLPGNSHWELPMGAERSNAQSELLLHAGDIKLAEWMYLQIQQKPL
jgi:hypothetical protein